jgi:hypothetical protein
MDRHFVTFSSPGTFMSENSTKCIATWDVNEAIRMARSVVERHGATPFGFQFSTKSSDSSAFVEARSPFYWLGGTVETLEQVEARTSDVNDILLSNMRCNGWDRIITTTNSYKWTQPLGKDDIVLSFP